MSVHAIFGDIEETARRHAEVINKAQRSARRPLLLAALLLALFAVGLWWIDFSPARLARGIARFGDILWRMMPPSPGSIERLRTYVRALVETLGIAFIGTIAAAIIAFPLALLAARNVTGSHIAHWILRRLFDVIRGIDRFVLALIFVGAVGLGPFAGALAIAVSNIGAFGKLFSEALEEAPRGPIEGVMSTGGRRMQALRFAVLPQIVPVIISQILYFFESDTRSATVIGIVGAGGIGLFLYEEIRVLEWTHVSFLILMILVTVALIDALSGYIRLQVIGAHPTRGGRLGT